MTAYKHRDCPWLSPISLNLAQYLNLHPHFTNVYKKKLQTFALKWIQCTSNDK